MKLCLCRRSICELTYLDRKGTPYVWQHRGIGFTAGTFNAYYMNGKFDFSGENEQRNKGRRQLVRSFIGYGFTFALSELMLWLLVSRLSVNKYIAKLLIMCVTIPLNFIINRFWIFKETEEEE